MAKSLKYQNDPTYSNIMSENMVKHADLKKKKKPKFELCLLKTLMISKFMKNWGGG